MNDELYLQLEQSMAEAKTYTQEALDDSMRCRKAEKDAIDAIRRVNFLSLCSLFLFFIMIWFQIWNMQ